MYKQYWEDLSIHQYSGIVERHKKSWRLNIELKPVLSMEKIKSHCQFKKIQFEDTFLFVYFITKISYFLCRFTYQKFHMGIKTLQKKLPSLSYRALVSVLTRLYWMVQALEAWSPICSFWAVLVVLLPTPPPSMASSSAICQNKRVKSHSAL